MQKVAEPSHVVAVFGGAVSGSTVAELLADGGARVVVFDQNRRPYGKIEDGLPRWHDKQREMEYGKIDGRLDRPGVEFVPSTKLGRDVGFLECVGWGWSAVLLANGAWLDRPLVAKGAEEAEGRGLVYQNPFVYWFNHYHEAGYDGPQFEVRDGGVVVGGGLASIDVIKILQLELYARALRERGVEDVDVVAMEHAGIPKYCAARGVEDPRSLGVRGSTLVYRRRVEDMPLASAPAGASEKAKAKIPVVRRRLLEKCQEKFLFEVRTQALPCEVVLRDGAVSGLVVQRTELVEGRAKAVEGSEDVLETELIVSSIGSIPEPIEGVEQRGAYYHFKDWDTGEYAPIPGVFGVGNVVTGQGNIKASLEHGRAVGEHLTRAYLGVGEEGERSLDEAYWQAHVKGERVAEAVEEHLARVAPLGVEHANRLLERVAERQSAVGYTGYRDWLQR